LDPRDAKALVRRSGHLDHLQPRLGARVVRDRTVRRLADRHPDHDVQPELRMRLLRRHEMPVVRRVEDASVNPNPHYARIWPEPSTTYLYVQSSRSPIGPRACSFCVELPISAPMPNSPPSVKRVDAFTYTQAASTPSSKARADGTLSVMIASEWPLPWALT